MACGMARNYSLGVVVVVVGVDGLVPGHERVVCVARFAPLGIIAPCFGVDPCARDVQDKPVTMAANGPGPIASNSRMRKPLNGPMGMK